MMTETELFAKYRETKDVALRDEIVKRYLYVASVLAKKFVGRGVEYDDLYQVACLALFKGIDRFDERKGVKFSTFITPTITGEIKNYFRDHSRLVHLPRKVSELRVSIGAASAKLYHELGRRPTAAEIAQEIGADEEDVLRAAEAGGVLSLDRAMDGEDGASFYEAIPAETDEFEAFEDREALLSAVRALSDEEKLVVDYRFRQELSQAETAKRMGVSQMFVSRIERKILQKLRAELQRSVDDDAV